MDDDNVTASVPGMRLQIEPTYWDALKPWLPLIHQAQARGKSQGYSVVTLHIVVDGRGQPQHWLEPRVSHISPLSGNDLLEALLRQAAGG